MDKKKNQKKTFDKIMEAVNHVKSFQILLETRVKGGHGMARESYYH